MKNELNYEKGYTYLWNRIQITIDLLKNGLGTGEQLINLLELAQIYAEEKCIENVERDSDSRARHVKSRRRYTIRASVRRRKRVK